MLIVLSCIVVGFFYVVTTRDIESIYAEETRQVVYNFKQNYLRDTVQNQIDRIESLRNGYVTEYTKTVRNTTAMLEIVSQTSDEDEFITYFTGHFKFRTEQGPWTATLWRKDTGAVEFHSEGCSEYVMEHDCSAQSMMEDFAAHEFKRFGDLVACYGVKWSAIDAMVKREISEEIHSSDFSEDTYIWVNEVIDYEGGERYAIRRIHPNLKETEGMYLSTSMTDIAGNFPYLEELEGINEDGELFFTYFFKRLLTDEVAEKLTYAKLYEPYNWIVAMGIHLEDMDSYITGANEESAHVARRQLPLFVAILVALVTVSIVSLLVLERLRNRRDSKFLEAEANLDSLTGAFNRRKGLIDLARLFERYKRGESDPAIIIFDMDDFKTINDRFGHASGDRALREVASCVKRYIRVTDRLYRWGGDEFVIVCEGLRPENVLPFTDSLRHEVELLSWSDEAGDVHVTISAGIAYFNREDADYQGAFLRADEAQYRAKRGGKNSAELSW